MAEESEGGLALPDQEAGVVFRTEMAATNLFLGYWKHLLAIVAVVLVGFFMYGQYATWYQKGQRDTSARIADVEATAPDLLAPSSPIEVPDIDALTKAGDTLSAVGADATGPGRVEAYLKAAEYYRRADKPEQRRAALEAGVNGASGVLLYAVEAALANVDLEQGNGDAAVTRLRAVQPRVEGFLAEQAALDLALTLEHVGKADEALAVYDDFLTRWPDSARTSLVQERRSRLSGGQG